jgi:NADH-quinone oxidoreductase subunit M
MGLPGFSGFVAEISIIIGVWPVYPWAVVLVAVGIIMTGAFSLRALHKGFFGSRRSESIKRDAVVALPPLSRAEIAAIAILTLASLAIGLHPQPWVTLIDDGLRSPLFQSILLKP